MCVGYTENDFPQFEFDFNNKSKDLSNEDNRKPFPIQMTCNTTNFSICMGKCFIT